MTSSRPDSSMTLLREVMEAPLDPGYAAAAARRARGEVPSGWRGTLTQSLVLVLAIALGFGGVWAARELRTPVPGMSARTVLMKQIEERTADGAILAQANADLRTEVTQLQQQALGVQAQDLYQEASMLGVWAGTTAVLGPGVVITMTDSERVDPADPNSGDELVKDVDLQIVVNELWACGAESIAVNGVRLTSSTAIRSAGQTVLVDLQPLLSPYRIEAIGDAEAIREAFSTTVAAGYLAELSNRYGIGSQLETADELLLPAGTGPAAISVESAE
ncbi:MAG: DUF881 domain-containing protein [Beutenbergiaceae bacterium]